jgi:hypothetical protein
MSTPATREEFKAYCLRRLGSPVITINVEDNQVEDRIDEAIDFYWQFHYSGTEKQLYSYQVQQVDIDNGYITMPSNIIGVVDILPPNGTFQSNNIFSFRYQIMLNDLYSLANQTLVPYFQMMQQIDLYEQILVGIKPIRFNVNSGRLYIDMGWKDNFNPGDFLIVCCYQVINPDEYTAMWGDRIFMRYTTALIKQQWGQNLKKYDGVVLIGGVKMNGQKMYDEATAEADKLETQIMHDFGGQLDMMFC